MNSNYKDLSNAQLMDLLKEDIFNAELIKEGILRKSESINHFLNWAHRQNSEITDFYAQIYELPEKADVIFFPNKNQFDFKALPENVIIIIPENKRRIYKTLDNDVGFYLKLRVEKVKGSLLEYKLIEQNKTFASFLNSTSYVGSAVALTASISIAAMFSSHLENPSKAAITPIGSLQQIRSNSLDVPFINSYEDAISEIKKGSFGILLEEITNHDIKLILSLTEDTDENTILLNKQEVISAIEEIIQPYVKESEKVQKIAESIFEASQNRKVDYLLFLSILKVETTTFNQQAVSSTGDISIAQIKPEVWTQEFDRLGKEPLDIKRLKKDAAYSIDRMGEILEIQNGYKKKDPLWYARYHSKTPSKKLKYAQKVQKEYLKIKQIQIKEVEEKIERILVSLYKIEEPEGLSMNRVFVNFKKIEDFKLSLTKLKKIINENKNKKLKQIVATL